MFVIFVTFLVILAFSIFCLVFGKLVIWSGVFRPLNPPPNFNEDTSTRPTAPPVAPVAPLDALPEALSEALSEALPEAPPKALPGKIKKRRRTCEKVSFS